MGNTSESLLFAELEKAGSMCSVIHIFSSDSLPKQVGGIGDFRSFAVIRTVAFFGSILFPKLKERHKTNKEDGAVAWEGAAIV